MNFLKISLYLSVFFTLFQCYGLTLVSAKTTEWWEFQSIDTMKYSRDTSSQFLDNPTLADTVISEQVGVIANTGATHVAIATPYDERFLPILKKWVSEARKQNLNVWFRGNWSGWEGWFGFPQIGRTEHLELTQAFILNNPELFEEGDIFSACPECENGGPGDPRHNGDVVGHRQFLIEEYQIIKEAFRQINKNIQVNVHPMNGDVARLVMDAQTTQALGGIVTIDHYVRTPEQLATDIRDIAQKSGGKIILGEFGAPIPDIHGSMTSQQQAVWIDQALQLLLNEPSLIGLNYWTGHGGSTSIWYNDNTPSPSVAILTDYFTPPTFQGRVVDQKERPISGAQIWSQEKKTFTDETGTFVLPYRNQSGNIIVTAKGYTDQIIIFSDIHPDEVQIIELNSSKLTFWERLSIFFHNLKKSLKV